MAEENNTALTVFEHMDKGEVEAAIKNLITGKTPRKEIRQREIGGGRKAPYVNGYYMFRQLSLITGFRWSSECLEEKTYPDKPPHKYLGARMKVTIWDKHGNQYSHVSWGEKPITEGTGYFDQWKAAYTDGIKKCLSYFGIANDVYGAKDLQFLGSEPPETSEESIEIVDSSKSKGVVDKPRIEFLKYLNENKILPSKVQSILGIDSIDDIEDFGKALSKVKEVVGK